MGVMGQSSGVNLESLEHCTDIRSDDAIKMAFAKCVKYPECKIELDDLPAKKWLTDVKNKYFNYGFNEPKWRMYANKQYKMRKLVENISLRNTDRESFVVRPTTQNLRDRIEVENPEGCLCDVPDSVLNAAPLDYRFIDRGFEIPDVYGFSDVRPASVTVEELPHGGSGDHDTKGAAGEKGDMGGGEERTADGRKMVRTFPEAEKQMNDEEVSVLIEKLKSHTRPWTLADSFVPNKRPKFGDKQ